MPAGYTQLVSYQLAKVAFDLGWEFVPLYFVGFEFTRQRDQILQALRSHKQNIVEGSSERSLSTKLKLYDVAKSSGQEALEDFEDILRLENFQRWSKNDPRLTKLRAVLEGYSPSHPSFPSIPSPSHSSQKISVDLVLRTVIEERWTRGNRRIRRGEHQEEVEIVVNYEIDVLTRAGYLLDRQIDAVERKHEQEGGYNEQLLKRRLAYRSRHRPSF